MFEKIARAFRKLDTTDIDAAIAEAERGHKDVQVRARALRMDVGCGDPVEAIRRLTTPIDRATLLGRLFGPVEPTPPDMTALIRKL